MTEIYSAGPRVRRVRFAMLLSLAAAVGGCWLGWELSGSTGPRLEDDGRLWGTVSAVAGIAFAIGMWLYGRHYIRRIRYDPTGKVLHFTMLGMFGDETVSLPVAQVQRSTYSPGRMSNPAGVSVNAPWFNIWVEGRRWPLILDAQGQIADGKLLRHVLKG